MAFEDLTKYQRGILLSILEALSTGEYGEEFPFCDTKTNDDILLVGVDGKPSKNIPYDNTKFSRRSVASKGYLDFSESRTSTRGWLLEKTHQHYTMMIQANVSSANKETRWDLFICHASEDKEPFVRSLVAELEQMGLRVWYDQFVITLGDSLMAKMDEGLAKSKYGIVVLSPHFFEKHWTRWELDGLASLERPDRKVILPIWHNITKEEVETHSPMLAGRFAVKSNEAMTKIVDEVLRAVRPSSLGVSPIRNVDKPDWSKSLALYTTSYVQRTNNAGGLMPPGPFLSISNVLPHIADVSVEIFRQLLRDKRLQISNVTAVGGWPWMYGFPDGRKPHWKRDGVIISVDSKNFWDFRHTGSFLFCTNHLCWMENSPNSVGIRTILISLLRDLTFAGVWAEALKVSGTGTISLTLHNVLGHELILEPDNAIQNDFHVCTEESPSVSKSFDFRLSKKYIADTGVAFLKDLFLSFPDEDDGRPFLGGHLAIIDAAAEKVQNTHYLTGYYTQG